jgi:RimJ/RimL family protein N-acetyltransferase
MGAHDPIDDAIDWRFETPRVRARLIDARDRALYRALYTDPRMMAHIGPVLDATAAEVVFEKTCGYNRESPMRARYWRLADRDSDEAIGMQSIVRSGIEPDVVELGLMLLPAWQGRRLGVEITDALLQGLFGDRWGVDAVAATARHAPGNARVGYLGASLRFAPEAQDGAALHGWRMTKSAWLQRGSR